MLANVEAADTVAAVFLAVAGDTVGARTFAEGQALASQSSGECRSGRAHESYGAQGHFHHQ